MNSDLFAEVVEVRTVNSNKVLIAVLATSLVFSLLTIILLYDKVIDLESDNRHLNRRLAKK